jgi:hypothetical protein
LIRGGTKRKRKKKREKARVVTSSSACVLMAAEEMTYVMFGGMGMDHGYMRELMAKEGWTEATPEEAVAKAARRDGSSSSIDFVWVEMEATLRFDPRSYAIRTQLKNIMEAERKAVITDKARLHEALARRFPAVAARNLAPTQPLRTVASLRPGDVLILRPIGKRAWGGKGIAVVTTDEELTAAKERMLGTCPATIASHYITDPLLWQGRKMHLRMYWLVIAAGDAGPFRTLLWEACGKILTAAKPYVRDCWQDKTIHDTHVGSTPQNLFWPDDLDDAAVGGAEGREHILAQMREVLGCVGELL